MTDRCRLCASNDHDALAEELAERMWESRRDPEMDGEWAKAGLYWHETMRMFAKETLDMLRHG